MKTWAVLIGSVAAALAMGCQDDAAFQSSYPGAWGGGAVGTGTGQAWGGGVAGQGAGVGVAGTWTAGGWPIATGGFPAAGGTFGGAGLAGLGFDDPWTAGGGGYGGGNQWGGTAGALGQPGFAAFGPWPTLGYGVPWPVAGGNGGLWEPTLSCEKLDELLYELEQLKTAVEILKKEVPVAGEPEAKRTTEQATQKLEEVALLLGRLDRRAKARGVPLCEGGDGARSSRVLPASAVSSEDGAGHPGPPELSKRIEHLAHLMSELREIALERTSKHEIDPLDHPPDPGLDELYKTTQSIAEELTQFERDRFRAPAPTLSNPVSHPYAVTGVIVGMTPERMGIRDAVGRLYAIGVPRSTRVEFGESPYPYLALRPGALVRATAVANRGEHFAREIHVLQPWPLQP